MRQPSTHCRIPEIERLRLGNVSSAVQIGNETLHELRDLHAGYARFKQRRQVSHGLVIRQAGEAFVIVSAPTPAVIPAKCFIDVISGKCGSGPVVTIRTRLRIHKETIEESEAKCE